MICLSQFEVIKIETDSTEIELTKNSIYRIWEETYNLKDSVFYSIRYMKDTTQLHIEGWMNKKRQNFGKWKEFKIDGTWLYTIDYSNHLWKYNRKEFKYQYLKDSMKLKADKILIEIFGQEFYDKNICFDFIGHTYIGKWKTYDDGGTFWIQEEYLGSWIEPIFKEPNTYVIKYDLKTSDSEIYDDMLTIELDSTGNLIKEQSKFETRIDEIIVTKQDSFKITKEIARTICLENPLMESANPFQTTLRFGRHKMGEYSGKFYYEVTQQYDEEKDGDCKPNCVITKYYNLWRIDPWSCELIFKEPMKTITRYSQGCGYTGNYLRIE